MGVVESVKALMWARQRQPGDVACGIALGHERFSPTELLDQAVEAMPLAEAPQGYDMFRNKTDGCIKVVLQP